MRIVTNKSSYCGWVGLVSFVIALLAMAAQEVSAQQISSFECGGIGASPSCDGWTVVAGVPEQNFGALLPCPGMPSHSVRFCQLPGTSGPSVPAFAGLGQPSAYPYSSGFTEMSYTFSPLYAGLQIDYNWSAPAGAPSWFEILLVDPTTNAVLDVFAQGDATVTPLPAPGCAASFGNPSPNGTGLLTGSATVPAAYIGQPVKVVVVSGENGTILIAPISFVNIDNLRYAPLPPLYPGNGADAKIEVSVNSIPQTGFFDNGQEDLMAGDLFQLRLLSPNGTLDDQGFALVYTPFATGSPPLPLPLLGGGNPADVWLDPQNAVVVLDSLGAPSSVLVPQLVSGGYVFGPFLTPAGLAGTSAMLQMFANAPGFNPVNIGVSDAVEFRFL